MGQSLNLLYSHITRFNFKPFSGMGLKNQNNNSLIIEKDKSLQSSSLLLEIISILLQVQISEKTIL